MDSLGTKSQSEVPAEVLATLAEIGQELNSSLDLDRVLEKTGDLVKRLIDYEIFSVMLVDEESGRLYHRFAIGYSPDVVDSWRIPIGQGITGTAAATGESVRVSDVSKDPRYINAIDTVRSELAVPLMYKGKAIGVLDIQSSQLDYFTRDQQSILTLLATRLAIAIENARLFERAKGQAETLLVLNEIARETSSILDSEKLLVRAAELIKRVINYQILSIMLYDEATNMFRHRLDVKYGQTLQGKLRVAATEGIVGAAAASRQPVRVPDTTADPRYLMVNPETRSELAIPLIHKNRVVGVLDLESPELDYFTHEHVQVLSILASQLAVSLENARLYEQVARDEARMERELNAAQRMQGALLRPVPQEDYGLDIAARIRSAREVCGDLYDFLRYGPQQLGIALGDVSGKGSAAALYGAVATGMLRSVAAQKLQPAELLRQLNQLICERRIEARYMTMCFATWQKGRQKLRVANAGQSQPLLWKDGRCDRIDLSGFPLGLYEDVSYDETGFTLVQGDVLVFHSDGLAESSSPDGQFFGTDRLKDAIAASHDQSAGEIADRLLAEVEKFTVNAPLSDDRTLVVIKVKPV
ncbi:MAG: GAF domain-containing SpoIIE family protein phosphatase [Candidatus Acidiferrales bacterium]